MADDMIPGEQTLAVERCLDQLRELKQQEDNGESVRSELLDLTYQRLLRLTQKMKSDFRGVGRWEQTEDVLQNASVRLYDALASATIQDARHYFRLAALQIRRELIDMCRKFRGPQGLGANHATQYGDREGQEGQPPRYDPGDRTHNPDDLLAWSDFHQCVEKLPDKEREVFELLWYHELKQDEAAELIGVSTRHVKRLWRSARLMLHGQLSDRTRESIVI